MDAARRVPLPPALRARYDVIEDDVLVGARSFVLAHPRSAEALIDEADFARDERLPYWADVWPSSVVLASLVLRLGGGGMSAVELGCGVGLVAVAAAVAGFDVTVSDYYEDAMSFAAANVAANSGRMPHTLPLDWRVPGSATPRYDVVLAADVLYERPYGALVASALATLLAPTGVALIADPGRVGASEFTREAESLGLHVDVCARIPVGEATRRHEVAVHEVRRQL